MYTSIYTKVMVSYVNNHAGQKALSEAVSIAKLHSAPLCVVHVTSAVDVTKQEEGHRLLEQVKASTGCGLSMETRLLTADPVYGLVGVADAIAMAAEEWEATLLVLGASNRRGLKLFVVGSVAESIINKVEASVLLVSSHFRLSVL